MVDDEISNLYPSKSEWAGFYSVDGKTEVLKPKSFESFDGENLNLAFVGLFHILMQIKKDKKNIKVLKEEVTLENIKSESVLFYYLYTLLEDLYDEVVRTSYFFYERKTGNVTSIKGKINFSKSLMHNFGLEHKKVCSYNNISFQHPILALIREYFVYFSNQFSKGTIHCSEISQKLIPLVSHVNQIFSETNYTYNYQEETVKLISGYHDQDHRFFNIIPCMKILGQFYLDNHFYFSREEQNNKLKMQGLVFNLNRPFEYIVRLACEKLIGQKANSYKDFTKVEYLDSNSTFQMKPDVWFEMKDKTVIIDVKHKIISQNFSDGDFEDIEKEKLDRNDMYQLVSYMMTHRGKNNSNSCKKNKVSATNVYGIVSLMNEKTPTNYNYIDFNHGKNKPSSYDLYIETVNEKITIVPMKLGSFLVDLGKAISNPNYLYLSEYDLQYEGEWLFEELGQQLNSIFKFKVISELELVTDFITEFNDKSIHVGFFDGCVSIKDVLIRVEMDDCYVSSSIAKEFLEKVIIVLVNSNSDKIDLNELREQIGMFNFRSKAA